MLTRGRPFVKCYKCTVCGANSRRETNHYGNSRGQCAGCSATTIHACLDPLPVGMGKLEVSGEKVKIAA